MRKGALTTASFALAAALTVSITLLPGAVASAAPTPPAPPAGAPQRKAAASVDSPAAALAARRGISRAAAESALKAEATRTALADRLVGDLAGRTGGAYLDRTGALVVTVTSAADAATVTKAGAHARLVTRSVADLTRVQTALQAQPSPIGTSWGVDTAANQVVVSLPTAGTAAAKATGTKQRAAAERYGDAVRVETVSTVATTGSNVAGGYPINRADGATCSAGFTVSNGIANYVLTAGHCTQGLPNYNNWDGVFLGPSIASNFPGPDHGLIRMDGPVAPLGSIYFWDGVTHQGVHGWATAAVGQSMCKSGRTTFLTCGTVTRVNVTVNIQQGTMRGLVDVNVCGAKGDSGGSLFNGHIAYGLLSLVSVDGANQCVRDGTGRYRTYFQPVGPALGAYGVWLIGG